MNYKLKKTRVIQEYGNNLSKKVSNIRTYLPQLAEVGTLRLRFSNIYKTKLELVGTDLVFFPLQAHTHAS